MYLSGWRASAVSDAATMTNKSPSANVLPPYVIIVVNDDFHTFEFVAKLLSAVLRIDLERAFQYANEIHDNGLAIVWSGSREVGELKIEQLLTFHEGKFGPLTMSLEPG